MSNPEVERAAEFRRIVRRNALPAACDIERSIDALETGLLLAGLLRTEADRLNAELADAILAWHAKCDLRFSSNVSCAPLWGKFLAAAKAVHEHRNPKPVERWTSKDGVVLFEGLRYVEFYSTARARLADEYAAARNAEERAK